MAQVSPAERSPIGIDSGMFAAASQDLQEGQKALWSDIIGNDPELAIHILNEGQVAEEEGMTVKDAFLKAAVTVISAYRKNLDPIPEVTEQPKVNRPRVWRLGAALAAIGLLHHAKPSSKSY